MRSFPFHMFPAALVSLVTQFDIYFFGFEAVEYHFRADQDEIYNWPIHFPAEFCYLPLRHFLLSILSIFLDIFWFCIRAVDFQILAQFSMMLNILFDLQVFRLVAHFLIAIFQSRFHCLDNKNFQSKFHPRLMSVCCSPRKYFLKIFILIRREYFVPFS